MSELIAWGRIAATTACFIDLVWKVLTITVPITAVNAAATLFYSTPPHEVP
jgi:hypothetical protein